MDVSSLRQWILCGVCFLTAIIILGCSLGLGNVPNYDDECGYISVSNATGYFQRITQSFEEAQSRIWLLAVNLSPNSTVTASLEIAAKRGVDVRIIATANSSLTGNVREVERVATNVFLVDNNVYFLSTLNESALEPRMMQLAVIGNERLGVDFSRLFQVIWMSADPSDASKLPSTSGVWDFNLLALVTSDTPAYVASGAKVTFAQFSSGFIDPRRTKASTFIRSFLTQSVKPLFIASEGLDLSSSAGIVLQNAAVSQALSNSSELRVLIGNDAYSLRQGAMIAGICPTCVRAAAPGTVPNVFVAGDVVGFSTSPVSTALAGNAVGVGIYVEDKRAAEAFTEALDEVWKSALPFKEAFDKILV